MIRQTFTIAAAPAYRVRAGRPEHPRDLLRHACLGGRFASGALTDWRYERGEEVVRVEPDGPGRRLMQTPPRAFIDFTREA